MLVCGCKLFVVRVVLKVSFIFSMMVIFAMMKWLQKFTFLPFVIYRVILGGVLILYSNGIF